MTTALMKPDYFAAKFRPARQYHRSGMIYSVNRTLVSGLMALWVFFFAPFIALGQDTAHPLKPPDRSSPRAAIKTLLDSGDAIGRFLVDEYLPSPSREKYHSLLQLADTAVEGLDLSEVPPAARHKRGTAAAMNLYEILNRIQLPPLEEIPDMNRLGKFADTNLTQWVIPNTEIVLVLSQSGTHKGEFLFSPETVSKADNFYKRVRGLAYTRAVPLENIREKSIHNGGWMIPYGWIKAMPSWLRTPVGGPTVWKWIALALILIIFVMFLRFIYRLSHWEDSRHPFLQALAQLLLPTFLLAVTPAAAYLALVQVNLTDDVGSAIELAATAVMFLAGAWISWRIPPVIAEAIIASPRISHESVNAHLIRIFTRLLSMVAAGAFLAVGSSRLGLPVYGVVAGLGIGGLAIALAAQSTVENLIGGLSLFADKPFLVGDFCQYGTDTGTVEAIGIRSTRIRGLDRTVTTIPNAALSKMPVINFAQRDRMLIRSVINVRYETSPEQIRYLLVKIREMLLSHPRIHHDPARARFIDFGDSSLDIEVFAYVMTSDFSEFLGIREDVLLRIMDIVEESGTSFAFSSQTLYLGRDGGLDTNRAKAAEAQVRQWRDEGCLPFPNFSPEQMRKIRGTLVYPAPGTTEASAVESESKTNKPESPPST